MNIVLDKKSSTEALIKISLQEKDYNSKVEEKVKDYSRKADIKGFRKGKVPGSVIQNMFGKTILVEEINHLISHSLMDYIKENNINIIGEPLPNREQANAIDWENQKDFDFEYNIGLVDDFSIDISSKQKVNRFKINIDDKVIDETITNLLEQNGTMTNPELSEDGDSLFGTISQVEGEIEVNGLIDLPLLDKKSAKQFIGLKPGDKIVFDLNKTFTNENLIAQILGIDINQVKDLSGNFEFTLKNVNRKIPGNIDQELFDKLFGKDQVKDEKGFREKIEANIEVSYDRESDYLLEKDLRSHLLKKTKITTPNAFLKQWLLISNEGKLTEDQIDKEFDSYVEELKWSLIRKKIIDDNKISVEQAEINEKAKLILSEQFGGPAIIDQLGDKMDEFVKSYLEGNEGQNYSNAYNQVMGEKVYAFIRESISITDKTISLDDFRKKAIG